MRTSLRYRLGATLFALASLAGAEQKDSVGCKDHPLFTRMPTYWIRSCAGKEFDRRAFTVGQGKTTEVEGRLWTLSYYPQATATSKPSDVQILRNYENAVAQLGGTLVWQQKGKDTFKLTADGRETWVEVSAEFTGKYGLAILQKGEMKQDVVADARALAGGLAAAGHIALGGVYFDSGKAVVKPDSAPALAEVAKLLAADPALAVYVVGHTDNQGTAAGNLALSRDRAAAVVAALVRDHGVAAGRLEAFGCGLYAPVATNANDAGRALNRRVELVAR